MKMFDKLADLAARPGKVDLEDAKREEVLVPIRLEFDVEHHRMREAFVWNLNGGYFCRSIYNACANGHRKILLLRRRFLRSPSLTTMPWRLAICL